MTLARSSAHFFAARLAKLAMAITAGWILADALGPEDRGAFGLILLLTSSFLFKVSNLGISGANQVLVARTPAQASAAAAGALWIGLGLGMTVSLAAVLLFPLWGPAQLHQDRIDLRVGLMLAVFPLVPCINQFESILLGQQRFRYVNAVHLASTAFFLVSLAVVLLWLRKGLDGAIACAVSQTLLNFLCFALPCIRGIPLKPDLSFFRIQLRLGLALEAVNFLAYLGAQASDMLLAPLGVKMSAIGNCFEASKIEQTLILTDSTTPVLLSGISSMPADQARAATARACRTMLFLQALAALAAWGVLAWLYPLLLPAYSLVPASIVFLVPGVIVVSIPKVLACYSLSVGKPLYGLYVTGTACVVAVTASLILIPSHGIHGAMAASSLGYAAEAAVSVAVFRRLSGAGLLETLVVTPTDLRGYASRLKAALARKPFQGTV